MTCLQECARTACVRLQVCDFGLAKHAGGSNELQSSAFGTGAAAAGLPGGLHRPAVRECMSSVFEKLTHDRFTVLPAELSIFLCPPAPHSGLHATRAAG